MKNNISLLKKVVYLGLVLGFSPAVAFAAEGGSSIPQLDVSKYPQQIFWFLVTFVVLYLLLKYIFIKDIDKVQDDRQRKIGFLNNKIEKLNKEIEEIDINTSSKLKKYNEDIVSYTENLKDSLVEAEQAKEEKLKEYKDNVREKLQKEITTYNEEFLKSKFNNIENLAKFTLDSLNISFDENVLKKAIEDNVKYE